MTKSIEARIQWGHQVHPEDGNCSTCPTGERFETFMSSITVQNGQPDDICDDELASFLIASIGKRFPSFGVLYWRIRPQFETEYVGENRKRSLRCRLFISDKPAPIAATEIQYEVVQTDLRDIPTHEKHLRLTINGNESVLLTLNDLLDMMNVCVRNGMTSAVSKCQP